LSKKVANLKTVMNEKR